MKIEEVGEQILLGPYTTCLWCKGSGCKPNHSMLIDDPCSSCQGSGKWLRGDYKHACFILDIPCPPKPFKEPFIIYSTTNPLITGITPSQPQNQIDVSGLKPGLVVTFVHDGDKWVQQ